MSITGEHKTNEIPIVCTLEGQEQAVRRDEVADIFLQVEQISELADGYAFRFPGGAMWAGRLVEFIIAERSCCPFFTFDLVFEAGEDAIWLQLRGGEGVRDFIKSEFLPIHPNPAT